MGHRNWQMPEVLFRNLPRGPTIPKSFQCWCFEKYFSIAQRGLARCSECAREEKSQTLTLSGVLCQVKSLRESICCFDYAFLSHGQSFRLRAISDMLMHTAHWDLRASVSCTPKRSEAKPETRPQWSVSHTLCRHALLFSAV